MLCAANKRAVAAPYSSAVAETEQRYGGDLDASSHGESFPTFPKVRLVRDGLYLLDEPEAALSPLRQPAFSRVKETVAQGGQFIVATHAPISTAYPEAARVRGRFHHAHRVREARDGQLKERAVRAFTNALPDGPGRFCDGLLSKLFSEQGRKEQHHGL